MIDISKYGEYTSSNEDMICFQKNGKYGYIGTDYKHYIKPVFDIAYNFKEGLAMVCFEKSYNPYNHYHTYYYTFIDKDGNNIIPKDKYTDATSFTNGFASVKDEQTGKWTIIDENGIEQFPPTYKYIYEFNECGVTIVKCSTDKYNLINNKGQKILKNNIETYQEPQIKKNFIFIGTSVFSSEGKQIIDTYSDIMVDSSYTNHNDEFVVYEDMIKKLYGFMDKSGNYITPAKYYYCHPFHNGFATVTVDGKNYYYIDEKGNEYLKHTSDKVIKFEYGHALVCQHDKNDSWCFFIGSNGERTSNTKYKEASDYMHGYALVRPLNREKIGFIDTDEKMVTPPIYDFIRNQQPSDEPYIHMMMNGVYGISDYSGKPVAPFVYDIGDCMYLHEDNIYKLKPLNGSRKPLFLDADGFFICDR